MLVQRWNSSTTAKCSLSTLITFFLILSFCLSVNSLIYLSTNLTIFVCPLTHGGFRNLCMYAQKFQSVFFCKRCVWKWACISCLKSTRKLTLSTILSSPMDRFKTDLVIKQNYKHKFSMHPCAFNATLEFNVQTT